MKLNQLAAKLAGDSTIVLQLRALDAPEKIIEAGTIIENAVSANLRPPAGLVFYVQRWVCRQREQNRWGK